jgi:hypothetical protein
MSTISGDAGGRLHLVELVPPDSRTSGKDLLARLDALLPEIGATIVESVWAAHLNRLYVVAEHLDPAALTAGLDGAGLTVAELAPVRLIGSPVDASARPPSHLVEWDLPPDLGLDQYLKRKAEKSPLYAQVPEVQFLRTYVREDAVKCLCLYDAPDEDAVRRARAVVSAPISRLDRVGEAASTGDMESEARSAGER